jgi:sortase A
MSELQVDAARADRRPRGRRTRRRPSARLSVVGVLGELLITAGVLVLLFIGWQQWLNDVIVGSQQQTLAVKQSETWDKAAGPTKSPDPITPPVITTTVPAAQEFAQLIIPRFGADWYRQIAQGISTTAVLNKGEVGHYPDTQMPGAIGNFAVAAHRTTYGANFGHLNQLQVGDHIFVETPDGWYQYEFRNLEYVKPTGVSVLDPVPDGAGLQPTDRMMTMTSCNPLYSAAERIVAFASFDKFYPRADGPPSEIAATVAGKA